MIGYLGHFHMLFRFFSNRCIDTVLPESPGHDPFAVDQSQRKSIDYDYFPHLISLPFYNSDSILSDDNEVISQLL